MSAIGIVGWGAVTVLVVLWLVISFSHPGPRRAVLEWAAATSLYVALSMLFLNLVLRMHAADNTFALVAFGLLLLLFSGGFCVSLFHTLRALLRRGAASGASATN